MLQTINHDENRGVCDIGGEGYSYDGCGDIGTGRCMARPSSSLAGLCGEDEVQVRAGVDMSSGAAVEKNISLAFMAATRFPVKDR